MKKVALLKSHMQSNGGLEKVTQGLVHAFAKHGAQVTLLTTSAQASDLPAQVINLGYRSKFSLKHHKAFDLAAQAWLKLNEQDVVFGMDRNSFQTHYRAGNGVHAAYLANRLKVEPLLKKLCLQVNPLHRFLLEQEKRAFASDSLRKIFTNSQMVKQQLQDIYHVKDSKLAVIANGVDWHGMQHAFEKKKKHDVFRFLFVGHGYKRKGLIHILQALPLLSSYHFELHVVGKDKQSYPSFPHVFFHGPVKDLTPFYQQCDALLVPSLYDPFANVTVEALAMGLFVVSSQFNGGHEVLRADTGVVIEELNDPASVAQAMRYALAKPHDPGKIRDSVSSLDFSLQLDKIIAFTLND